VLLVDHHNPERTEADVVGQKGLGTNNEVEAPLEQVGLDPRALVGGGAARQERDLEWADASDPALVVDLQSRQEASGRKVVLLGQHLGRDHQGSLVTALNAVEKGRQRHDRLARADVALKQPVHRVSRGQISRNLLDRSRLCGRELEGQLAEEPLDKA